MPYYGLMNFLAKGSGGGLTEYTINGVQSGTLPLGDYTVDGDIVVLEGASLTLTAGSIFRNADNVLWEIQGTLNASGTSGSHITFQKTDAATQWHGLRFCKEASAGTGTATVNTTTNEVSISGFTRTTNFPTRFTTTGTLPAPLEVGARYYFRSDNTLSRTLGGAAIDITDTGSGTHTIHQLSPSSSTGLQSTDYDQTNTLQYCDFSDAKKTNLPSQYTSPPAYRHWVRGGGLMAYQLEDAQFDNLTFTDCESYERGGGAYIEGLTTTLVALNFSDWTFTNCASNAALTEPGGAYGQSHGQQTTVLANFTFSGSGSSSVDDYTGGGLAFDAGADTFTFYNAGYVMRNGLSVRDFKSSGSIPGGLSAATNYYMINVSNDDPTTDYTTCQLSLTPGGSAVNLTDTGSGTITCDLCIDYYVFDTTISISGFSFS